ncbi:hypothetical protein Btru_051182 [Bulinus truncatus]|nr:hypothetical protein Btru_051182 [Bulinus truncatus]
MSVLCLATLVLTVQWVNVAGQSSSDLTIRIKDPTTKQISDTRVPLNLGHVLFLSLCKSQGNPVTLRINPLEGTADIMDEDQGLTNQTKGVTSCRFDDSDSHVTCTNSPHFCELNNVCVAEIASSCSPAKIRNMHYVDVTMTTEGSHLMLDKCLALCEEEGFQDGDSFSSAASQGLSDLALGLIVAGIVLFASLLVIGAVVWKIRDSRLIREHHHKTHHIHYVTS